MKGLALILAFALCAGGRSQAAELPQPISGWKIELIAEAPRLKHPSVVACAPDGRVFVAEDPMDISLPNANAAEGRILCFHPNGRVTVFADKLFAVFGLQYLEGKLYVLHNPKFSVFEDANGIGRNRRDLIEQTLPEPSALNWNDHVPANFRLAMDGYFYAAAGDKGLHGARGTDGSQADLFSGGVFRIRPDGSKLEVFSTGVRNILDVALTSEDEIFTYDNTDEHDWMGRVTHMVDGGFYGYPHDFIPRRPHTLWMLADLGPGAACGAFANTEDALPPEYRDNLFLADFGKRQVTRLVVEREGATFRFVSKEDLFPNPPGDFRPVGITQSADGRSIYICDWQHRDEKAQVTVGRLLKLTWAGKDHSTAKPSWFVPLAQGEEANPSSSELIQALAHPSRAVRLAAQRRLSRATAAEEQLARFAADLSASEIARIHALWALSGKARGGAVAEKLLAAPEPGLRRQALRFMALNSGAPAAIMPLLDDTEASVRFHAATALGRRGSPSAIPRLQHALDEPDLFARYAVFTALNRIGLATGAWDEILLGIGRDPKIQEGTVFALRETYDQRLAASLCRALGKRGDTAHAQVIVDLLGAIVLRAPPWKGEWWGYHPALQPPPRKDTPWAGTSVISEALRSAALSSDSAVSRRAIHALAAARLELGTLAELFSGRPDAEVKTAILRSLAQAKHPQALPLTLRALAQPTNSAVALAAIAAAEELNDGEATAKVRALIATPRSEIALAAIRAAGKLRDREAEAAVAGALTNESPAIRATAAESLALIHPGGAIEPLQRSLGDGSPEVRLAATRALASTGDTNAIPALIRAYSDPALRPEALRGLSRRPDPRALDVFLTELGSRNPAHRNAAHLAIREISRGALKEIEERAPRLSAQVLMELRQIYAGNPEAERGPIFTDALPEVTPEQYLEAALSGRGKASEGERLFLDASGVNCIGCHRVSGRGSSIGPDLTTIGSQFDRRALAESILFPSRAVREGYQQIVLELANDEARSGLVKGETAEHLTLVDVSGAEHRIARSSIRSRENSGLSLMPEGLHLGLTLDEFSSLIEYLSSLKP